MEDIHKSSIWSWVVRTAELEIDGWVMVVKSMLHGYRAWCPPFGSLIRELVSPQIERTQPLRIVPMPSIAPFSHFWLRTPLVTMTLPSVSCNAVPSLRQKAP